MKKIFLLFIVLLFIPACNESPAPTPNPTPAPSIQEGPAIVDGVIMKTGLINDPKKKYGRVYWHSKAIHKAIAEGLVPEEYDSRKVGCTMGVKDQGQCGSCWEHGTVSTGEINYCVQTGDKSPLNEPWGTQAGVSCETKFYGCDGGLFNGDFHTRYGFFAEKDWIYTSGNGNTGRCDKQKLQTLKPVAKPESFVYLGTFDSDPTAEELRTAIYQNGAISVSFQADGALNSIHDETQVVTGSGSQANHEVTAMAFRKNDEFGNKNSWGPTAQAKGYFWIRFGAKQFTNDAGYFVFKGGPCNPPKVRLPAEYVVHAGDEVALAVKPETDVTYEWREGKDKVIGTGNLVSVLPLDETEYRIRAVNKCGTAEVVTLVTLKK